MLFRLDLSFKFYLCLLLLFFYIQISAHTLFHNYRSEYGIINCNPNSESIKSSVSELHTILKEISGCNIPISRSTKKHIYVGINDDKFQNFKEVEDLLGDNEEAFVYFNKNADIYIISNSERGCLYAIYAFLENEFGCRWYGRFSNYIPRKSSWKFTHLYHKETPQIVFRNYIYMDSSDPNFSVHVKRNSQILFNNFSEKKIKGGLFYFWGTHTFDYLVPVEKYYTTHPEYYSEINGRRINKNTQLCLTNIEVLQICIDGIRDVIKHHPNYSIYMLSPFDNQNFCQCKNCMIIANKYGGQSGLLLWFVNQIAKTLEANFPKVLFGTTAYQYTRTAPKNIKPRHNVAIRLCSIECCFSHSFDKCIKNKTFISDLESWSQLTDKLFITDYVVSFRDYFIPFPNFNVLQSNVKTLRDNGVLGINVLGAYNTKGAEFPNLRLYILSKLLWNPDCDVETLIRDYMHNVYGASGKYVLEYFNMLQDLPGEDSHLSCMDTYKAEMYSDEFIKKAQAIFKKAKKIAETPEILKRVKYAELPISYLQCRKNPRAALKDGSFELFKQVIREQGITKLNELDKGENLQFLINDLEKKKSGVK